MPGASDPTLGPDDENGVIVGATNGVAEGAIGKFGRPGFSVPMAFNKTTSSVLYIYASIICQGKEVAIK